jgi:hypothetical protein
MLKVVDSIQYHVWSDALHARQLARQTTSPWNRDAYVRWAIQTAWSAFENLCSEVLETEDLGMRFRERFDEAVAKKHLAPVDWGSGVWQRVMQVYQDRKKYTHVVPDISRAELMAPLEEAERAIAVLRDGIKAISDLVGLPHPAWIQDDEDPGWPIPKGMFVTPSTWVSYAPGSENDPEAIRIFYVLHGEEHLSEIARPDTPYGPLLDKLLASLGKPVDAVRAYRGTTLLEERKTNMRT